MTLHIIIIRIEFNGGQRLIGVDTETVFSVSEAEEIKRKIEYYNSDTVYKFDSRPHDSLYFPPA